MNPVHARRSLIVVGTLFVVLAAAGAVWEYLGYVRYCQSPPHQVETAMTLLWALTLLTGLLRARVTNQIKAGQRKDALR